MLKEYIANFFYWYYFVKIKSLIIKTFDRFTFLLNKTNVLPMVKNINKPLYQVITSFGNSIILF